ncbi:hypothetical protein [Paenibacillus sp. 1P07SE]|uniref:hypothetical protein n=1 Tax=Paenibacillus sp. 1P07SE TaxID=3132209 RepID=UPI0039A5FDEF
MNKRILLIIISLAAVMTAAAFAVVSNSDRLSISMTFETIKQKLDQLTGEELNASAVAQVEGIMIDQAAFTYAKLNRLQVRSLGGDSPLLTDEQIIEQLITEQLVAEEALQRGLTVTEEDIDEQITYQREAFDQLDPTDEKEVWFKEVVLQGIQLHGMTEEEYWQSGKLREAYRIAHLGGELMREMVESGEVEGAQGYYEYQEELYRQIQDKIVYNHALLDEINATIHE